MRAEGVKLHWDWNDTFCVPPFVVYQRMRTDGTYYVSVKSGDKGWNALVATGELPPGATWEGLGETLLAMVELRYSQEQINEGHTN